MLLKVIFELQKQVNDPIILKGISYTLTFQVEITLSIIYSLCINSNMHTYLYGNISFCYFSHIEAYCRNHIFCELPWLEHTRKEKIVFIRKYLINNREVSCLQFKVFILQHSKISH